MKKAEMKLRIAQINSIVGDFETNFEKILKILQEAGPDELVVFPECSLSGYPQQDLLDYPAFLEQAEKYSKRLLSSVSDRSYIFGNIEKNHGSGKPVRNVAYFVENKKVRAIYTKRLLPTYDVFDEDRFFEPGRESCIVDFRGVKVGISICEDIWGDLEGTELHNRYGQSPLDDIKNSDVLVNLSASPFESAKVNKKREMLCQISKKYNNPLVYVNSVGANDALIFDGRSYLWSAAGELVASAKAFEEDCLVVNVFEEHSNKDIRILENESENIYDALVLGIKDYCAKSGFSTVSLGLSGGIDSAVVACLAEDALGASKVTSVLMPSRYTSKESLEDAMQQTKSMGNPVHILGIEDIFGSCLETLKPVFEGQPENVAEENVQSRIRGLLLMAISNKFGNLVLATGNKSELATGYCTLYGDMNGGLAPLSDVYKTQVYALGRFANQIKKRIPERVFDKAPSAELRENQTDQDTLPDYETLDEILKLSIEKFMSKQDLVSMGFSEETVEQVLRLVRQNEYKRFQMPLGLKVSEKAFGSGRRIPLVQRFS